MSEKSRQPEGEDSSASGRPQPAEQRAKLPDEFRRPNSALQLSRERIVKHLERTTHPSHRAMLERALAEIDAKLVRAARPT